MVSNQLLETAIEQFANEGFDGASTRDIARASGAAMSSITYHFGGKGGLYLAAADHVAATIRGWLGDAVEHAAAHPPADREEAVEAVVRLFDQFARMMLDPAFKTHCLFLLREQQAPTEAFDHIFSSVVGPFSSVLLPLVEQARPDLSTDAARATMILCFGQALVLRAGSASLCRLFGVTEIDAGLADFLRVRLRANVRSILRETNA